MDRNYNYSRGNDHFFRERPKLSYNSRHEKTVTPIYTSYFIAIIVIALAAGGEIYALYLGKFTEEPSITSLYFNFVVAIVTVAISCILLIYLLIVRKSNTKFANIALWIFSILGLALWIAGLVVCAIFTSKIDHKQISTISQRIYNGIVNVDANTRQREIALKLLESSKFNKARMNFKIEKNKKMSSIDGSGDNVSRVKRSTFQGRNINYNQNFQNYGNYNDCKYARPACFHIDERTISNKKNPRSACIKFDDLCLIENESNNWYYYIYDRHSQSQPANFEYNPKTKIPKYFNFDLHSANLKSHNANWSDFTLKSYLRSINLNDLQKILANSASSCKVCQFCGQSGQNCIDSREPKPVEIHVNPYSNHYKYTNIKETTIIQENVQHPQQIETLTSDNINSCQKLNEKKHKICYLKSKSILNNCDDASNNFKRCQNGCTNDQLKAAVLNFDLKCNDNSACEIKIINSCIKNCFSDFIHESLTPCSIREFCLARAMTDGNKEDLHIIKTFKDVKSFHQVYKGLNNYEYHVTYDSVCLDDKIYNIIYEHGIYHGKINHIALIVAASLAGLLFALHLMMVIALAICGQSKSFEKNQKFYNHIKKIDSRRRQIEHMTSPIIPTNRKPPRYSSPDRKSPTRIINRDYTYPLNTSPARKSPTRILDRNYVNRGNPGNEYFDNTGVDNYNRGINPTRQNRDISPNRQNRDTSPTRQNRDLSPTRQNRDISPTRNSGRNNNYNSPYRSDSPTRRNY